MLYNYVGDSGAITALMQLAWVVMVLVILVRVVRGVVRQGRQYFTATYWNVLRAAGVLASLVTMVTFVVKVVLTAKVMESVQNELGKIKREQNVSNFLK